jgi:hypothetical protein
MGDIQVQGTRIEALENRILEMGEDQRDYMQEMGRDLMRQMTEAMQNMGASIQESMNQRDKTEGYLENPIKREEGSGERRTDIRKDFRKQGVIQTYNGSTPIEHWVKLLEHLKEDTYPTPTDRTLSHL